MAYKLEKREKVLLLLLLVLVLGYAGYRFVLAPQVQAYRKVRAELNEARSLISQLSTQAASFDSEREALEGARKRFLEASAAFDTEMRDGQFLVQFSRVVEKNRVLVMQFKPLAVVDKGYVLVLPVQVELKGLYPQVTVVLKYLENLPVLSELRDVQISRYEAEKATGRPSGGESGSPAPPPVLEDGVVTAKMTLLLYSRPTPTGRLNLEEIRRWALGRPNPFFSGRMPALPAPESQTPPLTR